MPVEPEVLPAIPRVPFLGVEITALGVADAATLIAARGPDAPFAYVVTPNAAHFTRLGELKDARFADAYAHAWLRLLDGATPRKLARLVFGLDIPQAAGSDLTAYLFDHCVKPGDTLTVIGGNEEMRRRLLEQFQLGAVNLFNPSMGFINKPQEVEACVDYVIATPPATSSSGWGRRPPNISHGWWKPGAGPWARACAWAPRSISSPASWSGRANSTASTASSGCTACG